MDPLGKRVLRTCIGVAHRLLPLVARGPHTMYSHDRIREDGSHMEQCGMGSLGASISDAATAVRRRIEEFREKGFEKATEEVVEYVRAQPLNAMLIAAGLGLLLGILSGVRAR